MVDFVNNCNVTFVTSYIKIYNEEYDSSRTFDERLKHFIKLVKKGINICIFVSPEYELPILEITNEYKNVKLMGICSKNQLTFSNNNFNTDSYQLPNNRNKLKDTKDYMFLMNSKINFVKKVVEENPFSNNYFCWFDFSLQYIFKNGDSTFDKIFEMSKKEYIDTFLVFPGCWNKEIINDVMIKNYICWRFCGGFFMGDKKSILDFYNTSFDNFQNFLNQTNTLLWEVNYWAWLESKNKLNLIWYKADHNDSIIEIPECVYL